VRERGREGYLVCVREREGWMVYVCVCEREIGGKESESEGVIYRGRD